MFHRKSKADKVKEAATSRAHQAADAAHRARVRAAESAQHGASTVAYTMRERVKPKAGLAAAAVGGAALTARDRAMTGIDHGIDVAVPRMEEAVAGMGPKVDQARDAIVEDLLPRISELLSQLQGGKDDLLSRKHGTVATVTGSPKPRKRKGGVTILIGLLAAAGAGVAYYLSQQQSESSQDPWARADRPIGGNAGVDSQVREALDGPAGTAGGAPTAGVSTSAGAASSTGLGESAPVGTPTGATAVGEAAPTASTAPAADRASVGGAAPTGDTAAVDTTADSATTGDGVDARMLDGDDIDELASETPAEGTLPGDGTETTTGFTTDTSRAGGDTDGGGAHRR